MSTPPPGRTPPGSSPSTGFPATLPSGTSSCSHSSEHMSTRPLCHMISVSPDPELGGAERGPDPFVDLFPHIQSQSTCLELSLQLKVSSTFPDSQRITEVASL